VEHPSQASQPKRTATWSEVFGPYDARSATAEQRGVFIDRLYERAMDGREFSLSGAGEEAMWTWSAAGTAFVQGNWIATVLCCHAVCERVLAGRFKPLWMDEALAPSRWQNMGLGRLLDELEKRDGIDSDVAARLRRMSEYRKPFGHWKDLMHPTGLFARAGSLLSQEDSLDSEEAVTRVIVDDATRAIEITVDVLYGDLWP
jgi:hypothetical protein